jgi:catechol 2,3-dioxygenase-like lactoylglutathione lyase family enzyme
MNKGITLVIYPVKDLAKAKTLYSNFLGIKPYADFPYYVGYKVGDQEIGLDPNGHKQGMMGPVCYY